MKHDRITSSQRSLSLLVATSLLAFGLGIPTAALAQSAAADNRAAVRRMFPIVSLFDKKQPRQDGVENPDDGWRAREPRDRLLQMSTRSATISPRRMSRASGWA